MPKIALFHSTLRGDEKLLLAAARAMGVEVQLVDIRKMSLDPSSFTVDFDCALERSVSTTKGRHVVRFLERLNVPVFNSSQIATVCEDKFLTAMTLHQAGVRQPRFAVVFSEEQAKQVITSWGGYPVVTKPTIGSWGRLISKVNDDDALEALIDHKLTLGSPDQKALFIQDFIAKPGRDIRAFVIGGKVIAAIYRDSSHWITNTARGGVATNCPITSEMETLCTEASAAVGGGILAMDIFESEEGLLINEINHTMEFKNSEKPTGVSISTEIIRYCLENYHVRN
jgi:[lysine-biosynthesis-protein LysW]--L-2-aminoadipate ligase